MFPVLWCIVSLGVSKRDPGYTREPASSIPDKLVATAASIVSTLAVVRVDSVTRDVLACAACLLESINASGLVVCYFALGRNSNCCVFKNALRMKALCVRALKGQKWTGAIFCESSQRDCLGTLARYRWVPKFWTH